MSVYKRAKWYWMHDFVSGVEYRMALKTRNWQEALKVHKEKLSEIIEGKIGSVGKVARQTFEAATDLYLEERKLFKAPKTYVTEFERSKPLKEFFGDTPLKRITAALILRYQTERKTKGLANKTINLEVALLRQILKKHRQWKRIAEDVAMLPKQTKEARVMAPEEKANLLALAATRPDWMIAKCAAILALNTTMRGCELKGLRRKDVDLFEKALTIQRDSTKTDAGNRVIPLNRDAVLALSELLARAELLGASQPDHFVFPACECGVIDPTKPMKGWRTAWRHLTRQAGLKGLRFHDLRHQAITELCEAGLSDMTIMGIAGHVSREMLMHYSHIRMQAKREAVAMLETPMAVSKPAETTEAVRLN